MASLEVANLSHKLDEDESRAVRTALGEADVRLELDDEADPRLLERDVDDDLFADFFDQLDANDAACDIYVPADFEDVLDCAGYRVGSAHALRLVLEEIKDEIFDGEGDEDEDAEAEAEADDDDDEDYGDDYDDGPDGPFEGDPGVDSTQLKDDQMRHLWRLMYKGARTSIRERMCMFVNR